MLEESLLFCKVCCWLKSLINLDNLLFLISIDYSVNSWLNDECFSIVFADIVYVTGKLNLSVLEMNAVVLIRYVNDVSATMI